MEDNTVQVQTEELSNVETTVSQPNVEVNSGAQVTPTPEVTQTTQTVEPQQPEVTPQTTTQPEVTNESTTGVTTLESKTPLQELQEKRISSYLNKGKAISNLIQEFDYDPSAAGSMWVAGHLTSTADQMQFLEAILNEDMYSELDLSKFYFDQKLATARAYAREKKFETAYQWYRASQEAAISTGQLTGWYLPAEARYLLGQWTIAESKVHSDDPVERDRAASIIRAAEDWFAANHISKRGIKTLSMHEFEETVRHTKEEEAIGYANAAASQTSANAALRQAQANLDLQRFQTKMWEAEVGADLNRDGYIGFAPNDPEKLSDGTTLDFAQFKSWEDVSSWAKDNISEAFALYHDAGVRAILGDEYDFYKTKYDAEVSTTIINDAAVNNNGVIPDETVDSFKVKDNTLDESSKKVLAEAYKEYFENGVTIAADGQVSIITKVNENGEIEVHVYAKMSNGVWFKVDKDLSGKLNFKNDFGGYDKSIFGYVYKNYGEAWPSNIALKSSDGSYMQVGSNINVKVADTIKVTTEDGTTYYFEPNITSQNAGILTQYDMRDAIDKEENNGYLLDKDAYYTKGFNGFGYKKWDAKKGDWTYYEMKTDGSVGNEIPEQDLDKYREEFHTYFYNGTEVGTTYTAVGFNQRHLWETNDGKLLKVYYVSTKIGTDENGNSINMYTYIDDKGKEQTVYYKYSKSIIGTMPTTTMTIISKEDAIKYSGLSESTVNEIADQSYNQSNGVTYKAAVQNQSYNALTMEQLEKGIMEETSITTKNYQNTINAIQQNNKPSTGATGSQSTRSNGSDVLSQEEVDKLTTGFASEVDDKWTVATLEDANVKIYYGPTGTPFYIDENDVGHYVKEK